jgi:hypothetical protein
LFGVRLGTLPLVLVAGSYNNNKNNKQKQEGRNGPFIAQLIMQAQYRFTWGCVT